VCKCGMVVMIEITCVYVNYKHTLTCHTLFNWHETYYTYLQQQQKDSCTSIPLYLDVCTSTDISF